jgi:CRISPR-associated endonuclease/helicase Cas3
MLHNADTPPYLLYWGKLDKDSHEYHLLVCHCLDVAAVGEVLLRKKHKLTQALAGFLGLSLDELIRLYVFTLILHDLGKFASAFQALNPNTCEQLIKPQARVPYNARRFRHDMLGGHFWKSLLRSGEIPLKALERLEPRDQKDALIGFSTLLECVFGHHGKPVEHAQPVTTEGFTEPHNLEAAKAFIQAADKLIQPSVNLELFADEQWLVRLKQVSWHLAGLAVLADWIGSDRSYFAYCADTNISLEDYWRDTLITAEKAVASTGLVDDIDITPFSSIQEQFNFSPTPLQRWAETVPVDDSPQMFILEDVTGAGKTEAALALTHRLMAAGAADGFYFGLPTMATSNAMFNRVARLYQQMYNTDSKPPSIVLAHGARDMHTSFRDAVMAGQQWDTNYDAEDSTASVQCNYWLADSKKKALLAPVGVGTIDQALLAVLPRKHQSLRLLGLNRKVLIFDEVHAADDYMFELLESLLILHLYQGGSVILLTATLSQKQRARLCKAWRVSDAAPPDPPRSTAFPLATKVALDEEAPIEQPLETRPEVQRTVQIYFLESFDQCLQKVKEAVAQGQCVVWVRNSVDDAMAAFRATQEKLENPDRCTLFHSRFILKDRQRIEDTVLETFGKDSNGDNRAGQVLITTQVFQESLDADADVMISDICPIDHLIQRAGRLHRHTRDQSGTRCNGINDARPAPKLWVHAPVWDEQPDANWLKEAFLNTQYVYRSPGRLWLGMRELKRLGAITMPDDARTLIESVYGEDAYDNIPEPLLHQEGEVIGEERSKAAKAATQILDWRHGYCSKSAEGIWHDQDIDISTRHSDIETVEVLLVRELEGSQLEPWAGMGPFSIALSCVKVSFTKYANKLAPLPERLNDAEEELKQRHPRAKYLQCWAPELDEQYEYDPILGFHEKVPAEAGNA